MTSAVSVAGLIAVSIAYQGMILPLTIVLLCSVESCRIILYFSHVSGRVDSFLTDAVDNENTSICGTKRA